jgi:exportin-2 (importin alpha re-exporter)
VLPLLVPHLQNPSYVIHTYAAITIERILFIKQSGSFLYAYFKLDIVARSLIFCIASRFGQSDIRPHCESILNALFALIERGDTPQAVAANDHLMKCGLLFLFSPVYQRLINRV